MKTFALLTESRHASAVFEEKLLHRGCAFVWIAKGEVPRERERDAYCAVFAFSATSDGAVSPELVRGWIGHPHFRVIAGKDLACMYACFCRELDAALGNTETERKYLIAYPDVEALLSSPYCTAAHLVQTYLTSEPHVTERVRKRISGDSTVYTHTIKLRRTAETAEEREEEISEAEYLAFLHRADLSRKPIEKTRMFLLDRGKYYEIDLYPFWTDRAILELETAEEGGECVQIPESLRLIRDVTDDVRYKNARLADHVPYDPLD
jgi:CYTH domain-containing protein